MDDFPVDIVYTWVDGSDKKWLSKKNKALKEYNNFHKSFEVSGVKRFIDKDELKFSLRSIAKYCPWVRNIYLVTDNQIPDWLNQSKANIIVINHNDLFEDQRYLPTFNSHAIEMRLHHIKNLSKNFLSFNDDVFIGRPTLKKDFFDTSGCPKLYMNKKKSKLKLRLQLKYPRLKKLTPHESGIANSRQLILDKYGIFINENISHTVKALNKDILHQIERKFSESFNITLKNQFRDKSDTWIMALHAYYLISNGLNHPLYIKELSKRNYINKLYSFLSMNLDFGFIRLTDSINKIKNKLLSIKKYSPLSFCLNDWPDNDAYIDKIINNFLMELFPEKSSYEK